MRYLKVLWIHDEPTEPVEMYVETDSDGWETRKVEVFRDGTLGFASAAESSNTTVLGEQPVPSIEEIAEDPQFRPVGITKDEFEHVWARRHAPMAAR